MQLCEHYNDSLILLLGCTSDFHNHFWNLYCPFCRGLPRLNLLAADVATQAHLIEEAEALFETALDQPNATPLAARTLVGPSANNFEKAHRRAPELSRREDSTLRRAGLLALGMLTYDESQTAYLSSKRSDEAWSRWWDDDYRERNIGL